MFKYFRAPGYPVPFSGIALILVLTGTHPGLAQVTRANINDAVQASPELEAQRASERALKARLDAAKSAALPKITGNVVGSRAGLDDPHESIWARSPANINITVSQPLFDGGRILNRAREAEFQLLAGSAGADDKAIQVLLETINALARLQRDRDIVQARRDSVRSLTRIWEATRTRASIGDVARSDIALSRSRLDLAQADLLQAESLVAGSEATVYRRLGVVPARLNGISFSERVLPRTLDAAMSMAMSQSRSLRASVLTAHAARFATLAAHADQLPQLTADGSAKRETVPAFTVPTRNSWQMQVKLSVPIFDGGLSKAAIAEARAREEERFHDTQVERAKIAEEVMRSFRQWQLAAPGLSARERAVRQSKLAVASVMAQALGGERSILDVLDAERELVNANVALAQTKAERVLAAYALLAVTGAIVQEGLTPTEMPPASIVAASVTQHHARGPKLAKSTQNPPVPLARPAQAQ